MNYLSYDAIVIGTGAAGYNAACRIAQDGRKSVCIVTENVNFGTSRNTGSDKQTYYKLGLGGSSPDSVRQMAADLFAGGSVDGDNALCEAALSTRCFLNLAELGVPFPQNRYGEYVGYKTDHDPYARATSAGPLTSKFMTEALQKQAEKLDIPVYDKMLAVEILKDENGVCGLLCLDLNTENEYRIFRCAHIILATGGPAGIYADSVYPTCHTGSTGLALAAGASLQNMTEWQYGLASTDPRWNVSGTYMQVLPRFVSVDENGTECEFLLDYFQDPYEALSAVFLKGYQWPFDSRKVLTGSSVIDLLVYRETVLHGRKVYLDYRTNPFGLSELDFTKLSAEAYEYLYKADACFGTPIERLAKMNTPAIELYRSKGVELATDLLEIALCAQHNNGGIAVDLWWQTNISGLYAAGECAGTHGISRPGGSALNAGQVGSLRAAQHISASRRPLPSDDRFRQIASTALQKHQQLCQNLQNNSLNADTLTLAARRRMSDCGAAIRNVKAMEAAVCEIQLLLNDFQVGGLAESVYKLHDLLLTQLATLTAMIDYAKVTDGTRGSSLLYDASGDLREGLDELFRFHAESGQAGNNIQQVALTPQGCKTLWRPVRPMPADDDVFEVVWRRYREDQNIY